MSGQRAVPRRSTLGMSAFMEAVSPSSWASRLRLMAAVLNLSVCRAVRNTPGRISSRLNSIWRPSRLRNHPIL